MTDFAKIKADNLQTGTIYKRVSSGMIALEELVPQASPIRGKQNVYSNKGINDGDFTSEVSQHAKRRKPNEKNEESVADSIKILATIEQEKHAKEMAQTSSLANSLPVQLEMTKIKAKVELFASLKDKSPEEMGKVLELYSNFEV